MMEISEKVPWLTTGSDSAMWLTPGCYQQEGSTECTPAEDKCTHSRDVPEAMLQMTVRTYYAMWLALLLFLVATLQRKYSGWLWELAVQCDQH